MARITMTELAKIAGVDASTVSRALGGNQKRVAPSTMARIQRLAAEHGFVPDAAAASLRTGRSRAVAVLVPTMTDVAVAGMLDGIAQEAAQHDYLAVIIPTGSDRRVRDTVVASLQARRIDGVILADSTVRTPLPRGLDDAGLPFVLALRPAGQHLAVIADDHLGGRLAAQHLFDAGHRDFVVIAAPRNAATSVRRLAGFRHHLRQAGVALPSERVVHGAWGVGEGHGAMADALARNVPVTAVFALNDYNAIGASRALQDRGRTVGQDVALVGYNDISISAELQVPLTSIHNDLEGVGRLALTTLLALIDGSPVEPAKIPPTLVVRQSSSFVARRG